MALSTACQLISPGACVCGTLSITKTELYFEMDEDDNRNKKIDPKVSACYATSNSLLQSRLFLCGVCGLQTSAVVILTVIIHNYLVIVRLVTTFSQFCLTRLISMVTTC